MMMEPEALQCVVVLYKTTVEDSIALQGLLAFLTDPASATTPCKLLIYDNSPQSSLPPGSWEGIDVQYRHDPQNRGLASAYNEALSAARQRNITWLLLLDQDTQVEPAFLKALLKQIRQKLPDEVGAIVPRLLQGEVPLSPVRVLPLSHFCCRHI